jgi:hypothetical protein
MANPVVVSVPKGGQWTKVVENVTSGFIHILNKSASYVQTYRETGDPAPADTPAGRAEGAELNFPGTDIDATFAIDVYLWVDGGVDGNVRVDAL